MIEYKKPKLKVKKVSKNFFLKRRSIIDAIDMLLQSNLSEDLYALRSHSYSPSDLRLKKNIKPVKKILQKFSKVNVVSFEWKNKNRKDKRTHKHIGIIAQQIENIFPSLVHQDKNGFKLVDYHQFLALLVGAVKELYQINQQLQKRIMKLEKN